VLLSAGGTCCESGGCEDQVSALHVGFSINGTFPFAGETS